MIQYTITVCEFRKNTDKYCIVAIFYPFSQFCEIGISSLSLQKEQKTDPSLFQRGVEYGKYVVRALIGLRRSTRKCLRTAPEETLKKDL